MKIQYIDRYQSLKKAQHVEPMPFVRIDPNPADKIILYSRDQHRLDKLSLLYYGTPMYDWLILMANPEYTLEMEIPHRSRLRIPFPLDRALRAYQENLKKIQKY